MDERELLNKMPSEENTDFFIVDQTPEMEVEEDG